MGCGASSGMKYEEYDFAELPIVVRQAAVTLGYNKKKWDSGKDGDFDDYDWEELDEDQKKAATVLGYNEATWDVE